MPLTNNFLISGSLATEAGPPGLWLVMPFSASRGHCGAPGMTGLGALDRLSLGRGARRKKLASIPPPPMAAGRRLGVGGHGSWERGRPSLSVNRRLGFSFHRGLLAASDGPFVGYSPSARCCCPPSLWAGAPAAAALWCAIRRQAWSIPIPERKLGVFHQPAGTPFFFFWAGGTHTESLAP